MGNWFIGGGFAVASAGVMTTMLGITSMWVAVAAGALGATSAFWGFRQRPLLGGSALSSADEDARRSQTLTPQAPQPANIAATVKANDGPLIQFDADGKPIDPRRQL